MRKWVKVCLGILVIMTLMSIFQYYHDKKRALYRDNTMTLVTASGFRINQSTNAKSFYQESHKINVANAKQFAKHNIFHYSSLFKKVSDFNSFSDRELEHLIVNQNFFDLAISYWYVMDPVPRGRLVNVYEDADNDRERLNFMSNIASNPQYYREYYKKGQYQNQQEYLDKKDGDILQEYIDDKRYNKEYSSEDYRLASKRESQMEADDAPDADELSRADELASASSSGSSITSGKQKLTKKQKNIDNNYQDTLSAIADTFTENEGTSFHAGGQAYPKLPSEYDKEPKVYSVTFSTPSADNEDAKKFVVKLQLNKKNNTFKISNLNDLPSYMSESNF